MKVPGGLRVYVFFRLALSDPKRVLRAGRRYLNLKERKTRAELGDKVNSKVWSEAETLLRGLIPRNRNEPRLFDLLARVLNHQGKWVQELEALEHLAQLTDAGPAVLTRLGDARGRVGQNAAAAYEQAIKAAPRKATAELYYALGFAYECGGHDGPPNPARAAEAYKLACAKDPKSAAARVGEGALHASAGRWKQAQICYQARLVDDPLNADLCWRLGMAHDRCYEWAKAESLYTRALMVDPSRAAWHYRLGFVSERQGKLDMAAAAYLYAAKVSPSAETDWHYRAGYCLEKLGRYEEACTAYTGLHSAEPQTAEDAQPSASPSASYLDNAFQAERSRLAKTFGARLDKDCTNAAEWQNYSEVLEQLGRTEEAVEALQQAILRSAAHMPKWHFQLGLLLQKTGHLPQACAAFRDQKILQRPHGVSEDQFIKSASLNKAATYREFFDLLPLMENAVMLESFGGEGCSDNPLAIFTYMRKDSRFVGWRYFWVLNDMSKIPAELRNCRDVFFVQRDSQLYMRLLCTVPFVISNAPLPPYYVRKDGQEYLNTWHGTPLKTLGYDIEATPLQRANTARNLIQASMFIAPNEHTEHIMLDRYGVRNLFTGRSLLTGYPRIDMLVNADATEKVRLQKLLGLDPTKPVVLFAPTYRGHWASPELEAQELIGTLEKMKSDEYNLLFRGHYFAERFIQEMNLPLTVAPHAIDTCSLLSIVDILVTDYSSIFYDFLITRRPIIHFVPDWDQYAATRGVYFGKDQIPGIVCDTEDELLGALADCLRDPGGQISQKYLGDLERYCAFEDGKASERVIEAFFFNPTPPIQPRHPEGAKRILVHGGDLRNGAQFAALHDMLTATKAQGHVNTVVIDRALFAEDSDNSANARALLNCADVLIRFGNVCFSLEESWVNSKIITPLYQISSSAMQETFEASLHHEARRLFGHASFDIAIEFDSKRQFWGNLLSVAPASRRMLRLPGDVIGEMSRATPALERLIQRLPQFDLLLSETEALSAANRRTLTGKGVPAEAFAVLPVNASSDNLKTRLADPITDAQSLAFCAQDGQRLVVFVGADQAETRRILTAVSATLNDRQNSYVALLCTAENEIMVTHSVKDMPLANRIAVLTAAQELAPLMRTASAVVIPENMPFATYLAAQASLIGLPVLMFGSEGLDREKIRAAMARTRTTEGAEAPRDSITVADMAIA